MYAKFMENICTVSPLAVSSSSVPFVPRHTAKPCTPFSYPYQFFRVEVRLVLPSPQHEVWRCKAICMDDTILDADTKSAYQGLLW
jgi:hypothetical protein